MSRKTRADYCQKHKFTFFRVTMAVKAAFIMKWDIYSYDLLFKRTK